MGRKPKEKTGEESKPKEKKEKKMSKKREKPIKSKLHETKVVDLDNVTCPWCGTPGMKRNGRDDLGDGRIRNYFKCEKCRRTSVIRERQTKIPPME